MSHRDRTKVPELILYVEQRMLEICSPAANQTPITPAIAAIRYHLTAGGSRLRARLALDASLRLGLDAEDAVALSTTCELLHNASLVQDDLLDDEPQRRNRPSVWAAFDRTAAICAGDLMLASAYASLAEIKRTDILPQMLRHTHARVAEVILGQSEEKASEAAPPDTLAAYEQIAIAKSAALLALPIELPLIAADQLASLPTARQAVEAFAIAYQMNDDLADYDQDSIQGSLNAVSVLIRSGLPYEAARAAVHRRATVLLERASQQGQRLPQNCAAVMLHHADIEIGRLAREHELCHAR